MCPKDDEKIIKMQVFYAQVLGSLMYAMTSMRPNIYHIVGFVSRYQFSPINEHLQVVNHILWY